MAYRSMVSGCCFASSGRLNSPISPVPGSFNAATALPRHHGFREPVLRERAPGLLGHSINALARSAVESKRQAEENYLMFENSVGVMYVEST
jgi:hypothetical protein